MPPWPQVTTPGASARRLSCPQCRGNGCKQGHHRIGANVPEGRERRLHLLDALPRVDDNDALRTTHKGLVRQAVTYKAPGIGTNGVELAVERALWVSKRPWTAVPSDRLPVPRETLTPTSPTTASTLFRPRLADTPATRDPLASVSGILKFFTESDVLPVPTSKETTPWTTGPSVKAD